jgi:hypothetical protein
MVKPDKGCKHLIQFIVWDIADKQIAARGEKIKSGLQVAGVVSIEVTIAALVEALRAGKSLFPPSTVAARLNAQGMTISVGQVQQIFSQYGLEAEKKTGEQV